MITVSLISSFQMPYLAAIGWCAKQNMKILNTPDLVTFAAIANTLSQPAMQAGRNVYH